MLLLFSIFLFSWSCGTPASVDDVDGVVSGKLEGVVFKGLLEGGQVELFSYADGEWDRIAGQAETDENGVFSMEIGRARGNLLLVASGGNYVEEATGDAVGLGSRTLKSWVPAFEVGDTRKNVQVNPVTTLIVAYTNWRMENLGEDFVLAERRASRLMEDHFGGEDWRSTLPENPTTRSDLPYNSRSVMGILVSGISWKALEMARIAGTASRAVNSAAFLELLVEDIESDGLFNGKGFNGRSLSLHDVPLDDQTLRLKYALSIMRFLQSERNISGLIRDDINDLLYAIANSDSELFETAPEAWLLEPPSIIIDYPEPGSAVRGIIEISAYATDPVKVIDFGFIQPFDLRATDPVGRGEEQAGISANLDTSLFPDGPLTIGLFAENDRELRTEKFFEIIISNESPQVIIDQPKPGYVSGTVDITAYAQPNPMTEARIIEMYTLAPEGLEDISGIAGSFEASWDTALKSDGPYTIEIRAVDENGSIGYARRNVEIKNRDSISISGRALLAGRPVKSALVTALAIDMPDSETSSGYSRIGTSTTDEHGEFDITIIDRNYDGPISIRISEGGTWRSPINENIFSFPENRFLSNYLPSPDYLHVDGDQHQKLIIGAWSTMADSLARYYSLAAPQLYPPHLAWQRAEEMIAGHFLREGYPSLHITPTHDLTEEETRSLQDSLFSLGDIGLVQMLHMRRDVSVIDLVSALALDISTGQFDGNSGAMSIPSVGDVRIYIDTTRFDLAAAIFDFVGSSVNLSGITGADLMDAPSDEVQFFLDRLSTDDREIYGAPGRRFDQEGPEITWLRPDHNSVFGSETVVVEAYAEDDSEILSFDVLSPLVDGEPLTDLSGSTETIRLRIDNTVPPNADNYHVRVEVSASDIIGNTNFDYLSFTRNPPVVDEITLEQWYESNWIPVEGQVRGMFRVIAGGTEGYATERFYLALPSYGIPGVGHDQDSGNLSLNVEIDTTQDIPDGPLTIEVCNQSIDGRESCRDVDVLVDNSPPELSVEPAGNEVDGDFWFGCGDPYADCSTAPVTINYTVSDQFSGVAGLRLGGTRISDGGVPIPITSVEEIFDPPSCISDACEGNLSVDLSSGRYLINIEAYDALGNTVNTGNINIVVDVNVPQIVDLSGVFDDDARLDFRRQGNAFVYEPRANHVPLQVNAALSGNPAWHKMENRLSALTVDEAVENNIPLIMLSAWDTGDIFSSDEELSVEYLYSFSDDGAAFTDSQQGWQPFIYIPPDDSDDPQHGSIPNRALPLSLEMLGDELGEVNHHRLRVRVRDFALNSAELEYNFRMGLIPAPVAVEPVSHYPSRRDPQSIYFYAFGKPDFLPNLFSFGNFQDNKARIAKVRIYQPHAGLTVPVKGEISGNVEFTWVRRRTVIEGAVHSHYCWWEDCWPAPGGFNCTGCVEYYPPDPDNDYPPCLTIWGDKYRHLIYKVYSSSGDNCYNSSQVPMLGHDDWTNSRILSSLDLVFFDSSGARVLKEADGTFHLPEGEYKGYIRITPVISNYFISSQYTYDNKTLFGELLQDRRVFHQDLGLTTVHDYDGANCNNPRQCRSHETREEHLLLYERSLEWRGSLSEGGQRIIKMNLLTGSLNPLLEDQWRDPWTGGAEEPFLKEHYPVDYITTSQAEP